MRIHLSQRSKYALALALAALLSPVAARAAGEDDSASSPAKASLIRPLSITHTSSSSLDFGILIKNAMTAPVRLVLDPRLSQSSSVTSSNPSAVTPLSGDRDAQFIVTGEPGERIQVSLPSAITLKKGGGGTAATEMTVNSFQADVFNASGSANLINDTSKQFTMPTDGSAYLEVGGALTVDPADEFGDYSGTVNVTVSYV
jgi:hypothetical protein